MSMNGIDEQEFEMQCREAAEIIAETDVLVVVTGAGWGADSGLATYGDIAKVPAYQKLGLDYSDICQPHWLQTNPELFYGFWGQCFQDYRQTKPHEGFDIIARWRDDKNKFDPAAGANVEDANNQNQNVAEQIRRAILSKIESRRPFDDDEVQHSTPYLVNGIAGAFYCFTSNVDGHFYDTLDACEIHDCHGCIELWQCSDENCDSGIWRAPIDHEFQIDMETMCAPANKLLDGTQKDKKTEDDSEIFEPKSNTTTRSTIGHTTGNKTRNKDQLLQNMPQGIDQKGWSIGDLNSNWPTCGHCQSLGRPAILMFGDWRWKCDESQYVRWDLWLETMTELAVDNGYKVCVLEVGCGTNVQTCRRQSEQIVTDLNKYPLLSKNTAKLIRINSDDPWTDDVDIASDMLLPIQSRGLKAVKRIDEICREACKHQHY